jgi:glycosyltransferase involved in cell wall biosynthesis
VSQLISVIVPAFNAAAWIAEALTSVFDQTGVDFEVILVDDGSTDETAAIVEARFPLAHLVRLDHGGVSQARNVGTSVAKGEFIQYLDADDVLAPGKLAVQIELLERSGADVAYGDWQELVESGSGWVPGRLVSREIGGDPDVALFTTFWCPPAAYLFRRRIMGGFHQALPIIQDARFALDCALRGAHFARSAGLAAYYRVQQTSLSRRDSQAFARDCLTNAREVELIWTRDGLTPTRRAALVDAYGYVARASFAREAETFETAYAALERLQPGYRPDRPRHLAYTAQVIGYRRAEKLAWHYRRLKAVVR